MNKLVAKSQTFADFISYKLYRFWNKLHTRTASRILIKINREYYKLIFTNLNNASDYLRLSMSTLREGNAERAIRVLEIGLSEHPDANILLENYIRVCCEQERFARAIDFFSRKNKKLTRFMICHHNSGQTPDLPLSEQPNYDLAWLTNEAINKNFDDISALWWLVEFLEPMGNTDTVKKIYNRLSKCTAVKQEDYLHCAVSEFKLGNAESGFKKFEAGVEKYPKSKLIIHEYIKYCRHFFDFNKYYQLITALDDENVEPEKIAFDFYRSSIDVTPLHLFILKFRDIEMKCAVDDFSVLKEIFLTKLHENDVSLEVAKLYVFYCKMFDVDAEFSENIFQRVYSQDWGENDKEIKYYLNMMHELTLPMIYCHTPVTENVIRTFIASANKFSQQPFSLTEPNVDLGAYWAPWQAFFCLVQPRLYQHAISAFEKLAFRLWPRLEYTAPHISNPAIGKTSNRKIRIGFTTLDAMPMMSGFIALLDKDIFETVFLRPGKKGETKAADDWLSRAGTTVEYSDCNAYSAIDTIAKQEIDILISGPSTPSIFFPLLARLAHLHMILLEPNWMDGLKSCDYYISWQSAEPENYKEFYKTPVSLLKTPPYWIEKPSLSSRIPISEEAVNEIRQRLLGFGQEKRCYICANTPPKIHPAMDDILYNLLEKDPGSFLVLLRSDNAMVQPLKARLREKFGPLFERIIFLNTLKMEDAHSLLLSADCCIDSYPICGMSSSFDGIMLGVPIVTLPADIPFGRWTAAIYEYIGVSGLTARSVDEYISIAVKLANDKAWRLKLSAEIREKSSRYIESKASFDEFQSFIVEAWQRKQSGLPPANWVAGEWQC